MFLGAGWCSMFRRDVGTSDLQVNRATGNGTLLEVEVTNRKRRS